MLDYLIQWGHAYLIHFGVWISFMVAVTVYKNGVPDMPDKLILKAIFLSAFISLFSSHSHMHYLSGLLNKG